MWTRDEKVIWLAEKNSHKDKFLGRVKMPSQQKTERAFQSMQAYISNCPLGSKKQSNNFQFKNSLASKLIFPENQNLLITPLAVCASSQGKTTKGTRWRVEQSVVGKWIPPIDRGTAQEKASRYSRNVWIYPGNSDWWHCQRKGKSSKSRLLPSANLHLPYIV